MKISYDNPKPPKQYRCNGCQAHGIKLWREYQTIAPRLLCAACAALNQKKQLVDLQADGTRAHERGGRTVQIGWYVPAIPDEEGLGYWGYTSIPDKAIAWWKALPNGL